MMKRFSFFLLLCILPLWGNAQARTIDEVLDEIEFAEDTLSAVFQWVTDEIAYDVRKYEVGSDPYRTNEQMITHVLKKRKGVCEDYALLFDTLLNRLGYESYTVGGYTRTPEAILQQPHAWNVVKVQGDWRFFDPTWSAGYVNRRRFTKRLNKDWFKITPEEFIRTHVPFDPIWQCLDYPVFTTKANKQQKTSAAIAFEDSIRKYAGRRDLESLNRQIARIEAYSDGQQVVSNYLDHLDQNRQNKRFNKAARLFNEGIATHNAFADAWNTRRRKSKLKSKDTRIKLEQGLSDCKEAKTILTEERFRTSDLRQEARVLKKQISQLEKQLQQDLKLVAK